MNHVHNKEYLMMEKTFNKGMVIDVDQVNAVSKALEALSKTGSSTESAFKRAALEGGKFESALSGIKDTAISVLGALDSAKSLLSGVSQQLEVGDKMHKLALRIGTSTEALSEYAHIAKLSGTNLQQLAIAWQNQSINISSAASGYGQASQALNELHLSATDLKNLKPEEQFEAISTALNQIADKNDRLRLASKIFDSEGAISSETSGSILQIINQGPDAIQQMLIRARELNVTLSQDQASSIDGFNSAVTNLTASWDSLNRAVAIFAADNATATLDNLATGVAASSGAIEYLDEALIIGAGVISSRYVPAMATKAQATLANHRATVFAAKSELELSKQANHRALQEQAAAQRSIQVAQGMEMRRAAGTRLAKANQDVVGSQKRLNLATTRYKGVASFAGIAARGLAGGLSLLGGPLGVAMLAASAIATMVSSYESAEEKTKKLRGETEKLVDSLKNASVFQAQEAADNAAEARNKKEAEIVRLGKRIDQYRNQEPDFSDRGARQDQKDIIKQLQEQLTVAGNEYTELKARAEVTSAALDGAIARAKGGNNHSNNEDVSSTQELVKSLASRVSYLDSLKKQLIDVSNLETKTSEQQKQKANAIKFLNSQIKEAETRQRDFSSSLKDGKDELEGLSDKQRELVSFYADQVTEIERLKSAHQELLDARQQNPELSDQLDPSIKNLEHLIKQNESLEKKAVQNLELVPSAAREAAEASKPYVNAWTDANKLIDASFEDLWKGNLRSFSDFGDQLVKGFENIFLDLTYQTIGSPILNSIKGAIGLSSSGALDLGSGTSTSGASSMDLGNLFSPGSFLNGAGSTFTDFAFSSAGQSLGLSTVNNELVRFIGPGDATQLTSAGSFINDGLSNIASQSAFSTIGGGIAGGLLSDAFGLSGEYSSITGSIGTYVGTALLTPMLGPFAPLVGSFLGSAIGGLFGGKPSDKTQWAGFTGADNQLYAGGEDGEKFSQENRDAATQIADALNRFNSALDVHSGSTYEQSLQVTAGSRDGYNIKGSGSVTKANELGETPNGSANIDGEYDIYSGSDLKEGLEKAVAHMAEQAGVTLDIYKDLADENEMLGDAYMRLEQTEEIVRASFENLGIPFNAVGDVALTLSDSLVDAAGGLENYISASDSYYNYVYTKEERALKQAEKFQAQITEFNKTFGVEITDKASLRAYVESFGELTESNSEAYSSAMQLSAAVQGLEQSMNAAGGAAGDARRTFEALDQGDQDYFTSRAQQINQQYQDELTQAQELHNQEMANLEAQYEAGKRLVDQLEDLRLSNLSTYTPEKRQEVAASTWAETLEKAQEGDAQALAELAAAGNSYLTETRALYSSGDEYSSAWNEVEDAMRLLSERYSDTEKYESKKATLLSTLNTTQTNLLATAKSELNTMANIYEGLTGLDLSDDISSLLTELPSAIRDSLGAVISGIQSTTPNDSNPSSSASSGSLNSINDIYENVLGRTADNDGLAYWAGQLASGALNSGNIEQAIINAALAGSNAADKNAAQQYNAQAFHGLAQVPRDGFMVETHKNEMILPAPAARFLKSAGVTVGSAGMNTEGIEKKLDNLIGQIGNLARVVGAVGGDQINAVKGTAREIARAIKVDKRTPVMV